MTTKSYLQQLDRYSKQINNKLAEIYQLGSLATNIGVTLKADMIKSSPDMDKMGDCVSDIVDKENEAKDLIKEYQNKKDHIITQINGIEDTMQYQVLFSRYIEMKTYEEIAEDLNYCEKQIRRIHNKAIAEFEKKYALEYKD